MLRWNISSKATLYFHFGTQHLLYSQHILYFFNKFYYAEAIAKFLKVCLILGV